MESRSLKQLVQLVEKELLPNVAIVSLNPHDPVKVKGTLVPWELLGTGNYAAVFCHPSYPEQVIKIYGSDRPGFEEEVEVYRRLGVHPAFSQCWYAQKPFLILRRLYGVTLYDCVHRGLPIPEQVIQDIDQALEDARQRGLYPHDVHGRNVMMHQGRGLVVDISDFLRDEDCSKWKHLKRAYYWLYRPIIRPLKIKIPYWLLDGVRGGYRFWCRISRQ